MTPNDNFMPWPKIARLSRNCLITEKLDGTNAQIYIHDTMVGGINTYDIPFLYSENNVHIAAGSRTKWITPEDDNFGFARWVRDHAPALVALGHGRHFGEWWGQGIQRKYGLPEKRFSLFNVRRWHLHGTKPKLIPSNNPTAEPKFSEELPPMVGLVPVLYDGPFSTEMAEKMVESLAKHGSQAAPGFMDPEGIVVFHEASQVCFKKTIKDDNNPKSA